MRLPESYRGLTERSATIQRDFMMLPRQTLTLATNRDAVPIRAAMNTI